MKRACVIGWPIAHSRSPRIHGYWLRKYGIDGSYDKRAVQPQDVGRFLQGMQAEGLLGCNVTIPHKEAVYAAAVETMPAARAVGAANTLWFEGGRLFADNSDSAGFMGHLRASVPTFEPGAHAVSVLGAGGAARAIVHAFLEAGTPEVRIFNRSRDRADAVAAYFGRRAQAYDWHQRADRSREVGVLVNATSLGMHHGEALEMDLGGLDARCVVADLVYVPLVTPLLAAARARGLVTVDGLGMLLHQATPGFAKWFGVAPEVTEELRALVVADIEAG